MGTDYPERCQTPHCHREAVVAISGTVPIPWAEDDIDEPMWEDVGASACVPCALMYETGAGNNPNEVGWGVLSSADESGVAKVRDVLVGSP